MRKKLGVLIALLLCGCGQKVVTYSYDAVCNGIGTGGSYNVKIFTYGSNAKKARLKSRSHAVHAVLFRGVTGSDACQSRKPICNVSYSEKRDWFDNFFESGDYLKYVSFANGGYVDASDMVKLPEGKYRVGISVIVNFDALRKKMEKEGFARALDQGF